jgi:hypothetical protein
VFVHAYVCCAHEESSTKRVVIDGGGCVEYIVFPLTPSFIQGWVSMEKKKGEEGLAGVDQTIIDAHHNRSFLRLRSPSSEGNGHHLYGSHPVPTGKMESGNSVSNGSYSSSASSHYSR